MSIASTPVVDYNCNHEAPILLDVYIPESLAGTQYSPPITQVYEVINKIKVTISKM